MRKFVSRSPVTNEVLKSFDFVTDSQVKNQIQLAKKGFDAHKKLNFKQRSEKFMNLSQLISTNAEKYAELITTEIGKPITQSLGEVKKSAAHCRYYAENLEKILKIERVKTEARKSYIIHEPLGTIYQISPFNFPFWLVFKGVIPIMSSGNGVLARTSDSTPLVGLAVEELFREAGFDSNEFQNIFSSPEQLENICESKYIHGVSFTGSTQAGSKIAQVSGKYLKKSIMELGGSDPFIVCFDADLDLAVELAVKSRIANAGQVCISAKRFIISDVIYDKFVEKLTKRVQNIKIGDPFNPQIELGPLARSDLLINLQKQIEQSVQEGGKLLYGGDRASIPGLEKGNFIKPAIVEVNQENILAQQETFGPVFALLRFKKENEAVQIANNSFFGLGGTIISKDLDRAEELARQIETGSVFINEMNKTDSRLPSGGCKLSGYGRECSHFGAYEFTNIKTIWIS